MYMIDQNRVSILLIDDHALFTAGMQYLLKELADRVSIVEASNASQGLEAARQHRELDLVLLDLGLPDNDGLDTLGRLRQLLPATPVVVLSASEDSNIIRQAIKLGASGYIPKASSRDIVIGALRLVLSGGVYLPPDILSFQQSADDDHASSANLAELSPRQYHVLAMLAKGKSNQEIADELSISLSTVKTHLSTVFRVLGVRNRAEATHVAMKNGLVPD
jgi:DNA-binding NarL/FixJ family response regulator